MITKEYVEKALKIIRSSADWVYFFSTINSPEWIIPLNEKHIFNRPPSEGVWPPLQYLVRTCNAHPKYHDIIGKIVLNFPDTKNIFTHCEYVDIIMSLATTNKYKTKILKKEIIWLQELPTFHPMLVKKYGELLEALSKAGLLKEAIAVAEVLLDSYLQTRESQSISDNEAVAKYDSWQYQEVLKRHYPELIKLSWSDALTLLCRLLDKALQTERTPEELSEEFQDYSYIWRYVIESPNYASHEIKDSLITAIITTAETVLDVDPSKLDDVLLILAHYKWHAFGRTSLYLLRKYSSQDSITEIQETLVGDLYFGRDDYYHEYYELLKKYFSKIDHYSQDKIIQRIINKDFSYLKAKYNYTDDQVLMKKEKWHIQQLEPISTCLPAHIKQHYDGLVAKHGEPEQKGFYKNMPQVWMGPESPIGSSDLAAKTPQELIDYLKTWEPPQTKMFGPSKRGLGRILDDIITKDPEKYIPFIVKLTTVQEPTYVSATISGLRNAINQGRTFPWEQVVNLCLWVLDNQDQVPPRDLTQIDEGDIDPDWTWTKHTIASLLYSALSSNNKKEEDLYPFKDHIWTILEKLSEDTNPSVADENRYSDSENYNSLAINSVRGEALQAVIHYALWQYRKLEKNIGRKALKNGSFGHLPEVRDLLEKHLNKTYDPLIAMQTVYGQYLPWLVTLDKKWVKKSVTLIFPNKEHEFKYRKAAWRTYINYCPAYTAVFKIIKSEYDFWISQLPMENPEKDYIKNLAHHLMTFYCRNLLELDDLSKFFETAAPVTRSDAIGYIGFELRREDDVIQKKILFRLQKLWEHRIEIIKGNFDLALHFSELDAFIWWFESMAFDLDWAFQQLKEVLKLIRYPQHDTILLDAFRDLIANEDLDRNYLCQILDCLHIMVMSDHGQKKSQWWYWDAELILEQVLLRVQDEAARSQATDLINFIGALGHFKIKRLLQINPKP